MLNQQSGYKHRRRIGIITGSGPEAGLDLWSKILKANKEQLGGRYSGDLDAPAVTIFSEPQLGLSMELEQNDSSVWECMKRTATAMASYVDYYAIACNTLNYYQDRLAKLDLCCRLVSVTDVVSDHIREHRLERIALLGAKPVTDMGAWSPYSRLREQADIELPKDPQALHCLIYDVKTHGGDYPGLAERFATILDGLTAETVLLACTELPLIPVQSARHQLVDVTELLAHALVTNSLS